MVIHQNRYILVAQQLIRLWSGALGQRSGSVETIRTELEALAEQVGLDLALAHRLTPDSLDLLTAPAGSPDPSRAWLLAEMFYVSARLAELEGDAEGATESDARALHLYERLDPDLLPAAEIPLPEERIEELRRRLDERGAEPG